MNIPETNFPENPQASTSNLKTSATEIIPNKKRKRQSKQNTNNPPPTIARIRRISYKEVIKAPKQMRLLAMNVKLVCLRKERLIKKNQNLYNKYDISIRTN